MAHFAQSQKQRSIVVVFVYSVVAVFVVAMSFVLVRERISVTDIDAINYIEGAYSLRLYGRYASISGDLINHWPPGYSILLSVFEQPLHGALVVNSLSLGLAVVALWGVLQSAGWALIPRLGFVLVMGAGFFRALASFARPDILTYALFLVGVYLFMRRGRNRSVSYFIWSLLIPIKLIAITFVPGALASEWFNRERQGFRISSQILPTLFWALGIGSVVLYNYLTIGTAIPVSHGISTINHYPAAVAQFVTSIAREFLANWYGSLREPSYLLLFAGTLILAIASLATLRFNKLQAQLLVLGLAVLGSSAILALFRTFYTDARLLGYGVIVAIASMRVLVRFQTLWLAYGIVTVFAFIFGAVTVSQYGINHPVYSAVVEEILASLPEDENHKIFTNADRLFSVLGQTDTDLVEESDLSAIGSNDFLVLIKLANFDAIMTPIHKLEIDRQGWCSLNSTQTHEILYRC